MRRETYYEDSVDVYCTDTEKTVNAEIIDFKPNNILVVAIQRSIKLILKYDPAFNQFVGNMSGLEFTAKAPKRII